MCHVLYKLYIHLWHRSRGLGPQLIGAHQTAARQRIEHFAANERAGAFYEREGFAVERMNQALPETRHSGSCGTDAI